MEQTVYPKPTVEHHGLDQLILDYSQVGVFAPFSVPPTSGFGNFKHVHSSWVKFTSLCLMRQISMFVGYCWILLDNHQMFHHMGVCLKLGY